MDITSWLIIGVITGAVGTGYFVYGKRQDKLVPMLAGAALCIYPYLVTELWSAITVGVVLMAVPFVVRR